MEAIEVFKALADETRIRILNLLRKETLCVDIILEKEVPYEKKCIIYLHS